MFANSAATVELYYISSFFLLHQTKQLNAVYALYIPFADSNQYELSRVTLVIAWAYVFFSVYTRSMATKLMATQLSILYLFKLFNIHMLWTAEH